MGKPGFASAKSSRRATPVAGCPGACQRQTRHRPLLGAPTLGSHLPTGSANPPAPHGRRIPIPPDLPSVLRASDRTAGRPPTRRRRPADRFCDAKAASLPGTPRVGRLTSRPCSRFGATSVTRSRWMSCNTTSSSSRVATTSCSRKSACIAYAMAFAGSGTSRTRSKAPKGRRRVPHAATDPSTSRSRWSSRSSGGPRGRPASRSCSQRCGRLGQRLFTALQCIP